MPRKKTPVEIGSLARSHSKSAFNVLCGIMNSSYATPANRMKCAELILAYAFGRPTAKIEAKGLENQTLIINGADTRDIARRLVHAMGSSPETTSDTGHNDAIIDVTPDNTTISST